MGGRVIYNVNAEIKVGGKTSNRLRVETLYRGNKDDNKILCDTELEMFFKVKLFGKIDCKILIQ